MSIQGELDRARQLIFAAKEEAAKDLLLSLGPQIEAADRDDLMMEALAQLGELYLVRTAYDGVREAIRRIDECLAVYRSIRAGADPDAAAQASMSETEIDRMLCRYTRRTQFLRTGLAAAENGDHEGAELALLVLCSDDSGAGSADLADEREFLITYARIFCALALCDDALHVQSVPLWEIVIETIDRPGRPRIRRSSVRPGRHRLRPVLHRDRPHFRSGTVAAARGRARRGPRVGLGKGQNAARTGHRGMGDG